MYGLDIYISGDLKYYIPYRQITKMIKPLQYNETVMQGDRVECRCFDSSSDPGS